jgi:hypothetical protein
MPRNALLNAAQAASNVAADTVAFPVDALSWLLRKAGVPVPENALLSSDWMKQQGLMAPVQPGASAAAGETLGMLAPMAAVAKAPQIARGLLKGGENLAARQTLNPQTGAVVWHGSPHKFDKFDSGKIGTGEGAQAYGHGLYLADNPGVAKSYQEALSTDPERFFVGGKEVFSRQISGQPFDISDPKTAAIFRAGRDGEKAARKYFKDQGEWGRKAIAELDAMKGQPITREAPGALYKVDLPDPAIARMLDWDAPLSKQPEAREVIRKAFPPTFVDGRMINPADSQLAGRALLNELAAVANKRGQPGMRAAEPALRQAGIPGIRYLDGGSRGAGQGTRNYVVFPGEEGLLSILERNGQPLR